MASIICYRCDGKGNLPGFSHVANGVCFRCNGSGSLPAKASKNKGFSVAFIADFAGSTYKGTEFNIDGFFPNHLPLSIVSVIGFEGHLTAERQLLKDDNAYYIGQPVCRSSTWWRVPMDQWSEFKKHYLKVYKQQL